MSELFKHINYAKAYRKNRLEAAHWVLKNPEAIPELLNYIFEPSQTEITHKAAWVLEFVALENLELLYPHFELFFTKLQLPKKEQTVRPLAHLCELITSRYYKKQDPLLHKYFTIAYKKKMTECCFDWLLQDKKVACTARAMTSLYFLGSEIDWIHPELKIILQNKIHKGSAGYKNRASKIIAKL